jgi:class 3 adenylate cyclase
VLFADLVGFTPMSESRDPEQVRELLSQYFARCRRVVASYDGVIEKFIGDAVMAVWGVPLAHEDDPERAVRAGLDLASIVAELGEEINAPLALRVGVVTGEVAVTIGATAEGMVAGDPVNTASRVQSAAEPGQVWVDDATRALTSRVLSFRDAGLHELKGKAAPMRLFAVESLTGDVPEPGGATPLIGRDRELRLLQDLFATVQETRRPRLVVVDGDAGAGKTRLSSAFEQWCDSLGARVRWHRGRCLSYGQGLAYWALAEAVRTRLGLVEGDPADAAAQRLDAVLADLSVDPEESEDLRRHVAGLIGAGPVGEALQQELFVAWARFLELVGGGDPVVLVLEDAHHADDGLLDFVEHLMRSHYPTFVLALARPELLESRPGWGGRRAAVVPLGPLDETAMGTLLYALVPSLGVHARAAIVSRAGGVPLFAVETMRTLADHGLLDPTGRARLSSESLDSLGAPTSLRSLVLARLDSLATNARRVVGDGSVLGLTLTRDGLLALGSDPKQLDYAITDLLAREILVVETDPFSGERGQLRFAHAVVRQVAYDTLSRRDRKARHVAAADYLDRLGGDELTALVGQHLLDAFNAAFEEDDDRADLRRRAITALEAGAGRASDLGANGDASRLWAKAADLASAPDEEGRLAVAAARSATTSGRPDAGFVLAERAVRCFDAAASEVDAVAAAVEQARALTWLGRDQELAPLLELRVAALESGPHRDDVRARMVLETAWQRLWMAAYTLGGLEGIRVPALRQVELARSIGDPERLSSAYYTESSLMFLDGDVHGALTAMEQAVAYGRIADVPWVLLPALAELAFNRGALDVTDAPASAREAMAYARRVGNRGNEDFARGALLDFLTLSGDFDLIATEFAELDWEDMSPATVPALAAAEAAFAVAVRRPLVRRPLSSVHQSGQASSSVWTVGVLHAVAGTDSRAWVGAVRELSLPSRDDPFRLVLAVYRAVPVLIQAAAPDLARELMTSYTDWDPAQAGPVAAALWAAVEGLIASTQDATAGEAVAMLTAAELLLRACNAHAAAAQCREWLGWACARSGDAAAAETHLDAAVNEYERMGAHGWLANLQTRRTTT